MYNTARCINIYQYINFKIGLRLSLYSVLFCLRILSNHNWLRAAYMKLEFLSRVFPELARMRSGDLKRRLSSFALLLWFTHSTYTGITYTYNPHTYVTNTKMQTDKSERRKNKRKHAQKNNHNVRRSLRQR